MHTTHTMMLKHSRGYKLHATRGHREQVRLCAFNYNSSGGSGGMDDIPPSKRDYTFDKVPYIKKYKDAAYAETAVNALEQLMKSSHATLTVDDFIEIVKSKFHGVLYDMEFIEGPDARGGGFLQIDIRNTIEYVAAKRKYKHIITYFNNKRISHIVIPIIRSVELNVDKLGHEGHIMIPINWSNDVIQSEWGV